MITMPANVARLVASQREQADRQRASLGIDARSWYSIRNAADADEAEVMLYDEIGGWWGCTADQLIADLRGITAPRMRVRVNSPGGSVFEGIAIANALRSHPANVTVQIDGIAASIASVIAMAGDRIEMAPNTMMMIHDASGVCLGNSADMEEMAELLDLISDNIADAYAARAGGTRDEWRARMKAETWYLPDDAVENGLADEAVQVPKAADPVEPAEEDEPDMARAFDLAAYGYTGPARPEAPKPGPPPAPAPVAEQPPTLVISVADLLDEDAVARLRAAVAAPAEPAPEQPAEPVPAVEDSAAPTEQPVAPEVPAAGPAPADDWAADVAHLTTSPADEWAADLAHLVDPDSSSSAATSA